MAWNLGVLGSIFVLPPLPNVFRTITSSRINNAINNAAEMDDGSFIVNPAYRGSSSTGGKALIRFDANGSVQWSELWNDPYSSEHSMSFDADKNIYLGGFYAVRSGDYYSTQWKFAPNGSIQWQKWRGGGQTYGGRYNVNASGQGITRDNSNGIWSLDANGNTVFTKSSSTVGNVIPGDNYMSICTDNAFSVVALTGAHQWGKSISSVNRMGVYFDGNDDAIVYARDNANNGIYVAKLEQSTSGNILWEKRLSVSGEVLPSWADTDSQNSIYLGGTLRFQSSSPYSADRGFIVKIDSNGNIVWQRFLDSQDSSDATRVKKVRVDGLNIIISGEIAFNGEASKVGYMIRLNKTTGGTANTSANTSNYGPSYSLLPGSFSATSVNFSYSSFGGFGGSTSVSNASASPSASTAHSVSEDEFN